MAQSPDWQQFLEAGMHFTAMTRAEAQLRARKLVREGQLAQERVQAFVEDLLDTSRQRADEFVDAVRHEVERQLKLLGVASRLPGRRPAGPVKAAKQAKPRAQKPAKTVKKVKKVKKAAKQSAQSAKKSAEKSAENSAKASGTSKKKSAATKATKAAKKSASAATKQSP